MSLLEDLVDQPISVITNDGRNIVGILRGFDQLTNVILDQCHERVYSQQGVEQVVLGLYIIRGDNVAIIGEINEDLDRRIDFSTLRTDPLKPVVH
mmetsp:Transcript_24895/g.34854  ORF Transcript_24895/g.34854 Transcript_24895/m.34854 type:complete len:95 (+) Transcript_24895:95-379(+)